MAEDCSAGFAIMPIIFIFVFISILSRALRGASRMGGGYSSYGGGRYRTYGSGGLALQYLMNQGTYPSSGYSSYNPPYAPPSSYRSQPYTQTYTQPAYNQPAFPQPGYGQQQSYPQTPSYPGAQTPYPTTSSGRYGSAFPTAPAPAYSSGQPSAYAPSPPVMEAPKLPCNYCGSLNPGTERNCLLCGAPIK